jgi:hypothetical protein
VSCASHPGPLGYPYGKHREGARLYRSGDHGRWLPDGKLEFLGRRDGQVKVSGSRVEIGEVESSLVRVAGVSQCAVVVADREDGPRHLVAFYSGPGPVPSDALRAGLGVTLPAFMVPAAFHWLERLPLSGSGKVDRMALAAIARDRSADRDGRDRPHAPTEQPRTRTEQRLEAAWADVLGLPAHRIGRGDDFFDQGGMSLSAVKLTLALAGAISLKDATRRPVLADQAAVIEGASG